MDVFLFLVIKGVLMIAEKINGIRSMAEGEGSREVNFPLYGLIPCYCLHHMITCWFPPNKIWLLTFIKYHMHFCFVLL